MIAACAALVLVSAPAWGKGRTARCSIASASGRFDGPCVFAPESRGSFLISAPSGRRLVGETVAIGVYLTGPGRAEVSGLTTSGINSRWGPATRSRARPACWIGQDFSVCAI